MLDFGVVAVSDGFLVGEGRLVGGRVVHAEAGGVGGEGGGGRGVADVGDGGVVVGEAEGVAWSVDFGPWLLEGSGGEGVVACFVDVLECAGRHGGGRGRKAMMGE